MLSGGQILAGFANQIWHLYLTQGVLFGFGLGFVSMRSSVTGTELNQLMRAVDHGL